MSTVRIAASESLVTGLSRELAIPHTLQGIRGDEGDDKIASILEGMDVFVSPIFKSEWRRPKAAGPRLVHSDGAGVNGIDSGSLPPRCKVCNVYGHERAITEKVFMFMLALQKNLLGTDAALRKGDWSLQPPYLFELGHRHVLLLGLGHIGSEVARWARFMGMTVTVLTRNPARVRAEGLGLQALGGLKELRTHLPEADFVVVAIPAVAETVDLIGEAEFLLLKPSAFVINVGRAAVINEKALYEALRQRRIAGAALDVWYQYPDADEQRLPSQFSFQELDNVIMTPHKATAETVHYRLREIAKNIGRFARGEPLQNVVTVA